MPQMSENTRNDYRKFYIHEGDPGFSPERNKWVVEDSIRKSEARRKRANKAYDEGLGERIDAVVTYLMSLKGSDMPIERYFGRRGLAYLRGQKIIATLQANGAYKLEEIDRL